MLHKIDSLSDGKNNVEGPGGGDPEGEGTVDNRTSVLVWHQDTTRPFQRKPRPEMVLNQDQAAMYKRLRNRRGHRNPYHQFSL
jgi:hypothetical protein